MSPEIFGNPQAILQTPQDRLLFTVSYQASQTVRTFSETFPRSLYSGLELRLSGTISKTESCAGTLATNPSASFLRGLRIVADGEVVKDISGPNLRVLSHHIFRGQDSNFTDMTAGTDSAEAFNGKLALDFAYPLAKNPAATLFPANRFGQIEFAVDWGARGDMLAGGSYSGESFPTSPTLEVRGEEIIDPAANSAEYFLAKYRTVTNSISSLAQTEASYELPTGEVVAGVLLHQKTSTPDTDIATLVVAGGDVIIRVNGSNRKLETTWRDLTEKNQRDYGIAMPTGFAFIDFMRGYPRSGGDFNRALRADRGVSQLELLLDTASVGSASLEAVLVTLKPSK